MTPEVADPLRVAARVATVLETLGLQYSIGGSVASSFSGEPRATLDIDMLVSLDESHVGALVAALQNEFYVDRDALALAARDRSSTNLIHLGTSVKVDLFVAGGSILDDDLLRRRVLVIVSGEPGDQLYVHTPEDILLQKLRWYRLGGDVSDRPWRDVLGIVRVQGVRLDREYLDEGARRLGLEPLLTRALHEGTA